ncbi:CPBP family intramembrane glutamic endopeptidase [Smaragdicoccus niigatensis]|uniref:CPBP family intramembrane glutamic endopeptidase n=1 Tax=Smaragdicoccus niigatensis TaxID=359359 RepID=UPI00058E8126|nr:CPBP family intramembrane glutamic endopeptidase [Smaragdicoccus niigatensis]
MNTDTSDAKQSVPTWRLVAAGVTLAVGAWCTWASLRIAPGDPDFLPMATLLALTWLTGAIVVGGRPRLVEAGSRWRLAIGIGVALCVASLVGGALVRFVPYVGEIVLEVLAHSASGPLALIAVVTAAAGLAEELFFRGALYSLTKVHPIVVTTCIYALVTAASGNIMLVGAAVLVGGVTAVQRSLTGGIAVSVGTHVLWAMTMLFALPHLLG